ncbi:TrbI/VirB10 family protein [Holosporaceae bacterium 'Namur']|nr:TrbI/VirB10 family protein [Holosporaceae bacterium 'Namur']
MMMPDDKNNKVIEVDANHTEASGSEAEPSSASSENSNEQGSQASQFSIVASTPQHKKVMAIGIVVVTIGVLYYIFFGRPYSPEEIKDKKEREIAAQKEELLKTSAPVTKPAEATVSITPPKLPDPPPLTDPTPPEPPPPPTPLVPSSPLFNQSNNAPIINNIVKSNSDDLERTKKLEAKRKAGMIVVGGGGAFSTTDKKGATDEKDSGESKKKNKVDFLGFGNGSLDGVSLSKTSSEQVTATKIGNTDLIIAQGKVINAVLETAINTDLPGMLRAAIVRDVYAESGKNILLPKGSRVVGTYDSEIKDGQTRVSIVWDRVIRPDGIDLAISSPGTDQLGRAGVEGKLDNKFWTKLGSALLVSYVIPVLANKFTNVNKNDQVSTTTTTGVGGTSTTSQSTFAAQQAQEASDQFTKVGKEIVEKTFSTKPTITVNQGAYINIYVKKDLVFPSGFTSNSAQVLK